MVISQIVFALFLATGIYFFAGSVGVIRRNILLGKDIDLSDNPAARWKQLFWVAKQNGKKTGCRLFPYFDLFRICAHKH